MARVRHAAAVLTGSTRVPTGGRWLAASAARAEQTLRSMPSKSLGPAGRRLLAAISDEGDVAPAQCEPAPSHTGEKPPPAPQDGSRGLPLQALPSHPKAPTVRNPSQQLPLIAPVRDDNP